jgi:hypothetical protein
VYIFGILYQPFKIKGNIINCKGRELYFIVYVEIRKIPFRSLNYKGMDIIIIYSRKF